MKKLLPLILLIFFLSAGFINGQMAIRQAGARLGYTSGIFYQVGSDAGNAEIAYNMMLSFRKHGVQFTGLKIIYETTLDAISHDLYFGWGYGGHLGFIYDDHVKFMGEDYYFTGERFCPLIGGDGFLTFEYRVHEVPLAVSLNFKPFIELTFPSFIRLMPGDVALSISYMF
jgi:hypothetical protein